MNATNSHYVGTMDWKLHCVEKNPGILTKVVKGNPCGSDLVFRPWCPKWGAHSGLFVYPSPSSGLSQAVTAFLLLQIHVILSKISLFEGLKLARPSGPPLQTTRGTSERGSRLDKDWVLWRFLQRVSSKNPSPPVAMTTWDSPTTSADWTVSSFPQGDVVTHLNLYQPGF